MADDLPHSVRFSEPADFENYLRREGIDWRWRKKAKSKKKSKKSKQ
jgi:hypothetical protein